jgi:hypothetical protein
MYNNKNDSRRFEKMDYDEYKAECKAIIADNEKYLDLFESTNIIRRYENGIYP